MSRSTAAHPAFLAASFAYQALTIRSARFYSFQRLLECSKWLCPAGPVQTRRSVPYGRIRTDDRLSSQVVMADAGRPVRGIPFMGPLESAPRKQAHEARQEAVEPCLHKVRFLPGGANVHAAQILVLWNSFQGGAGIGTLRCRGAGGAKLRLFGPACLCPQWFGHAVAVPKEKTGAAGPPLRLRLRFSCCLLACLACGWIDRRCRNPDGHREYRDVLSSWPPTNNGCDPRRPTVPARFAGRDCAFLLLSTMQEKLVKSWA